MAIGTNHKYPSAEMTETGVERFFDPSWRHRDYGNYDFEVTCQELTMAILSGINVH